VVVGFGVDIVAIMVLPLAPTVVVALLTEDDVAFVEIVLPLLAVVLLLVVVVPLAVVLLLAVALLLTAA
jgi:hypothetical protein